MLSNNANKASGSSNSALKKARSILGLLVVLAILVLIPISFMKHKTQDEEQQKINNAAPNSFSRVTYLNIHGLKVDEQRYKQEEITIPLQFNDLYQEYNNVMRRQGFDLSKYKGARACVYTYDILNFQNGKENMQAVLIVLDNTIIGGHIHDTSTQEYFPLNA